MGGPIKQGIMHGIREPYRGGGPTGTGLVGDQRYPKTGGREHHGLFLAPLALRMIASQGAKKLLQKGAGETFKKVGKTYSGTLLPAVIPKTTAPAAAGWLKTAWQRDPLVRGTKWLKEAITGPTAKTWGKKAVQSMFTPTGVALTAAGTWGFWPDGTPKGPPTDINKPGGYPVGPPEPKAKV